MTVDSLHPNVLQFLGTVDSELATVTNVAVNSETAGPANDQNHAVVGR